MIIAIVCYQVVLCSVMNRHWPNFMGAAYLKQRINSCESKELCAYVKQIS